MNAPRRPDGPPVRDGKPYSAIAHLAEDVKPFVAMAQGAARARLLGAGDLSPPISTPGPPGARGSRRASGWSRAIRRRRSRSATRRPSTCWSRCIASTLPDVLPVAPHVELSPAALRHRRVPDRGRTAARLVSAASRQRVRRGRRAREFLALWRDGAAAGAGRAADLGAARLSFAEPAVAAATARASRASACSISRTP